MDRPYLVKAIKTALRRANSKPIEEAAEIVADSIIFLEDVLDDGPPSSIQQSQDSQASPGIGETVIHPPSKSPQSVAPLGDVSSSTIYRTYQELYNLVNNAFPMVIESKFPDGTPVKLARSISASGEDGVVVMYMAQGQTSQSACPKASFWITDEKLDFVRAISVIHDQASKIYGFAPKVIRSTPTPPPQGKGIGVEAD